MERPATPIDVAIARGQHRAYVEALRSCGLEVEVLPADDGFPDGCFVEDCALVTKGVALITHPGAPSRVGERIAVREALARRLPVVDTELPATLDGGDCMITEDRIFVGLSSRTNDAGLRRVREVFEPRGLRVVPVPVRAGLHLKSVCSYLGRGVMLLASGSLPRDCFSGLEILPVSEGEAPGANVVSVVEKVIVAADCPGVQRRIAKAGYEVVPVDTSELRKADGALTCLSIVVA